LVVAKNKSWALVMVSVLEMVPAPVPGLVMGLVLELVPVLVPPHHMTQKRG
jgi:hypothetical protein